MKLTNAALIQENWSNEVSIKARLKYNRYNIILTQDGDDIIAKAGSFVNYGGVLYTCSEDEIVYNSALVDGVYYLRSDGTPAATLTFSVALNVNNLWLDPKTNMVFDDLNYQAFAEIRVVNGVYSFSLFDGSNTNRFRKVSYKGKPLDDILTDVIAYDSMFPLQFTAFHDAVNDYVLGKGIALKLKDTSIEWSENMLTWASGSGDTVYNWTGGAYHDGRFCVVGVEASVWKILYSDDGKVWTEAYSSSAGSAPSKMRYMNGMFITWGNGRLITSPNGIDWSLSSIDSGTVDLCYGNGIYVSSRSTGLYSSEDLSSWTLRLTHANNGVAFNGQVFADAPSGQSSVYRSTDGITWTTPSNATWYFQNPFNTTYSTTTVWHRMGKIEGGDGFFLATVSLSTPVDQGDYYLLYSTDALHWGRLQSVNTKAEIGPFETYGIGNASMIRYNDHMFYSWGAVASPMKSFVFSPSFFTWKYRSSK